MHFTIQQPTKLVSYGPLTCHKIPGWMRLIIKWKFPYTSVIPLGILRYPMFHESFPMYLNFANLGIVLGHEMTHGFDHQGNSCLRSLHSPTTACCYMEMKALWRAVYVKLYRTSLWQRWKLLCMVARRRSDHLPNSGNLLCRAIRQVQDASCESVCGWQWNSCG